MTLIDLLTQAFQSVNIFRPGESIPAADAQDAKTLLNVLIDSLNIGQVYASTRESKVLTASQGTYTWGTAGNITTARPVKLTSAFINDGTSDYPVEIIGQATYDTITDKTQTGRPYCLFYNPTYPLGTIYLYYVPDQAYILNLNSEKDLAELDVLTTAISLPPEYMAPLIYNLGVALCGPYEKDVPPAIAAMAQSTLDRVRRINAANRIKPIRLDLFGARRGWDIRSGGV